MFPFEEVFAHGFHSHFGLSGAHEVKPALLFHGQFYPALLPNALAECVFVRYRDVW